MPRRSSTAIPFSEPASRVGPPADLVEPARSVFVDIATSVRPDHFQELDAAMLAVYSRAIVQEKAASAGLAADGYVTSDGKASKASPWLPVLQAATRCISTYSRMFEIESLRSTIGAVAVVGARADQLLREAAPTGGQR